MNTYGNLTVETEIPEDITLLISGEKLDRFGKN
jgi:hypothetical protein